MTLKSRLNRLRLNLERRQQISVVFRLRHESKEEAFQRAKIQNPNATKLILISWKR